MKKIIFVLVLIGMITLQSCEGPEGPPGYSAEAEVFEVNRSFTLQNDFSGEVILNPPILPSDHILIYRLAGTFQGEDDWKLVPEYYFFEDGTLDYAYNYSFTRSNIALFMEGFDLPGLSGAVTSNQIFRVVIIPGYFSGRMDYSNYKEVMKTYGLTEADVKPISERQ